MTIVRELSLSPFGSCTGGMRRVVSFRIGLDIGGNGQETLVVRCVVKLKVQAPGAGKVLFLFVLRGS